MTESPNERRPLRIAVIGNIASGKSTTVEALSEELGLPAFRERFEENPFLAPFYSDPERYAERSQLWFTGHIAENSRRAAGSARGSVVERMVPEVAGVMTAELHNRAFLAQPSYELILALSSTFTELLPRPDVVVHLDASPEVALERARLRARAMEASLDEEYLTSLRARYVSFVRHWRDSPIVTIDTERVDIRTLGGRKSVVSEIYRAIPR